MKMGAIIAQTSKDNAKLIYDFGLNLGLAFQLQDDYLDAFGDPETFGKQVGGDIIENKKDLFVLKRWSSQPKSNYRIEAMVYETATDIDAKIAAVKEIFNVSGGSQATQDAIQDFTFKAFDTLDKMNLDTTKKEVLRAFEGSTGRKRTL
jgi:geranylgeranyl diphosphate synthase type II